MILFGLAHMIFTLGLIVWAFRTGRPEPLPRYPRHALWTTTGPTKKLLNPFKDSQQPPAWAQLLEQQERLIDLGEITPRDDHRLPGDK